MERAKKRDAFKQHEQKFNNQKADIYARFNSFFEIDRTSGVHVQKFSNKMGAYREDSQEESKSPANRAEVR